MATVHNSADKEQIASVVLMPGDPYRARYIAGKFLENAALVSEVRGMLAYTGMYKGKRVTVMGSGMGCGSMGIYSHELFNKYDVEVIVRAGSCGAYTMDLDLKDIFIPNSCWSQSTYAQTYSGYEKEFVEPDPTLWKSLCEDALNYKTGCLHTSDCFYYKKKEDKYLICEQKHCLAVDMESFALLHNANQAHKKAATILTVSDHSLKKEKLSVAEREQNFDSMIQIALDTLASFA